MIRKTTKGQYVFRDCDLLAYICGFSDVSDSARIARVCRGAFSAAIPFVWRQVEGVYNLLGLSPEIDISGPFENGSCGLDIARPPRDTSPSATIRLTHYKLCIKSINIFSRRVDSYHSSNWTDLVSHLQSQPPLPNLTSLDISRSRYTNGMYHTLWIKVFACSSLVAIRLIPHLGQEGDCSDLVPTNELQETIKVLVVKSPHVKELPLLADVYARRSRPVGMNPPDSRNYANLYYGSLSSLSMLCNLSCNLGMLLASLSLLGNLPHLRSLTVWFGSLQPASFNQELHSTSFPALTSLNLYHICHLDSIALDVLISMLGMLSRLDTLRISIRAGKFVPRDTSGHSRLFLPLKNLSNLKDIYVNYAPDQQPPLFLMHKNPQLMQPILPLPSLETVYLDRVNLSLAMSNALRSETTWRQVTYLCIPFHCVWVHTLSDFARLPNLQHLTLQLSLSTDFSSETRSNDSDENGNGRPMGVKLNILEGSAGSRLFGKQGAISSLARRETDELARQLLKIWPNLRRVVWPTAKIPATELEGIKLLNLQITEPWRINGSGCP